MSDIFVSYAHIDDDLLSGMNRGWVGSFVSDLKVLLAAEFGRSEHFTLWRDTEQLRGDHRIAGIKRHVEQSEAIVVILSTAYLQSTFCIDEQNWFCARHAGDLENRIFLVEFNEVAKSDRERLAFSGLAGFRFWNRDEHGRIDQFGYPVVTLDDRRYHRAVTDVARQLAASLKSRRAKSLAAAPALASRTPAAPAATPGAMITLGDVTDDLTERRQALERRLESAGVPYRILDRYSQPIDRFSLCAAEAVRDGGLFVQLMGATPFRSWPGAERGFGQLQVEIARAAGCQLMAWRPPELKPEEDVRDQDHRGLLLAEFVEAVPFEVFRTRVVGRAESLAAAALAAQLPKSPPPSIFINADARDRELAVALHDKLMRRTFCTRSPDEGDPIEIRQEIDDNIRDCETLVLLYGASGQVWTSQQMRNTRKLLVERARGFRRLIVVDAPPADKPPLTSGLPDMEVIDWRAGHSVDDLARQILA